MIQIISWVSYFIRISFFANDEEIIIFGKYYHPKKSYTSILFPLNIDSKYHSFGTSLQSKKKTLKNRQIDHMPNEPWEFFFKKIGSICFEEGPG